MEQAQYNQLFSFIWNIATDVLVYAFDKGEYKKIIMPMMVLRRIDVLLEPTKAILLAQKKMLDDNKDVVIGCKFLKDSKLDYPFKRKVISMGYYIMLLVLFHLNVKDTQTGLKVFRVEAIKPVAHLIRTSGFAYDIELLVAIHRRGFSIAQMPVEVVYVRDSGVKRIGMKDIWQAFCDTWAIFGRVYFRHYYD